ncbi:MAG: tetratricopeptide (TPR) repeat protein, partial [Enterobacterales bacterium]
VPEDSRTFSPRCTLCRAHLTPSNAQHVVKSFWKEGLYFLRLPLSSGIFPTLIIYSLVGALLSKYGLVSTMVGGIYFGLLVMMLFELANLIGEGRTDIPTVQEIWNKGERFLLVRLLLQVGLIAALIISINSLWFTVTLLIIYGLGFPASVIILALEKRFFSAINPLRIIYIITAIGAPYIILYVTWLLALAVSLWMQEYHLQGHFLISSLSLWLSFYIWTAWFAMLGYATFQYHQQLGIAVAPQHKHQRKLQQREKKANAKSAAVKEAEILIAESRHEDALNLLSMAMNQPMAEMDVHRFYLKILISLDQTKRLNTASKHLVRQFIHQNKHSEAVQVAVLVIELLPDWSPDLATDTYSIALSLIKMSRRQYALDLLLNLMTKDGPSQLMAKVYYQAAKLLAENFNQDENAIELLENILSNYPEQPQAREAKTYLKILKASRGDADDDTDALIINED